MNRILPILSVMLLMSVSGCRQEQSTQSATAAKPESIADVKPVRPHRGEITRFITLPATVAPNQQSTLYAKVAGYLKSIAVDKGDSVRAGDAIAEIEAPELLADLAKVRADFEVAKLESDRAIKAHEKAPELVVEQAVDAARAKFLAAKANLERAETLLKFCTIAAPFAGTVTARYVDPGTFIPAATSGSAAGNAAIATIMDFSVVRAQAAVPEPEVPLIRKDLPVQLLFDEFPGRIFTAKLSRFANHLDEARTMLVEADLPNSDRKLLPGMFASMRIGLETRTNALLLPTEAVSMEKANAFVFALNGDTLRKLPVKLGFKEGAAVEVTEGLAENQIVASVGKTAFADGQRIRVVEGK